MKWYVNFYRNGVKISHCKVLNELVIAFANSATYYMKGGKYTLSEKEDDRSNAIWEQLAEVGYYNK